MASTSGPPAPPAPDNAGDAGAPALSEAALELLAAIAAGHVADRYHRRCGWATRRTDQHSGGAGGALGRDVTAAARRLAAAGLAERAEPAGNTASDDWPWRTTEAGDAVLGPRCSICGAAVPQPRTGRPARYDRDVCRREASRRRLVAQNEPPPDTFRAAAREALAELPELVDRLTDGVTTAVAPDAAALTDQQRTRLLDTLTELAADIGRAADTAASGPRQAADVAMSRAWMTRYEPAQATWQSTPAPATPQPSTHSTTAPTPAPASARPAAEPSSSTPSIRSTVTPSTPAPVPARRRAAGGALVPTSEQAAVIEACTAGGNLVIEALAGTGKTSTLRMAADAMSSRRGVYIAYNKAIATDAAKSFPHSVTCSTAHSLAYRAIGYRYKHRLSGPRMPARETAARLGITTGLTLGTVPVPPVQLARLVMATVDRYCQSADRAVTDRHVPFLNALTPADRTALAATVVPLAERAWQDILTPDGALRFSHDCYLKMWQLNAPRIDGDVILLDEAQDANPVIASIVQSQHDAQLIAVGDPHQAIYAWRGAIDALATWPADTRLALSQSFRFGPRVAEEGNKWLELLRSPHRIVGSPDLPSTVGKVGAPTAMLCRTNSEAVRQAMTAMDDGRRAALVGGGAAVKALAEAALQLQQGRKTTHPELWMFRTWGEVQDYAHHDGAGELATFVRLVDEHGPDLIINTVGRLATDERRADLVVSTAHKAKGREWPTVKIATDFKAPKRNEDTGRYELVSAEESRLSYVAVTRARDRLDPGGLDWPGLFGALAADSRSQT